MGLWCRKTKNKLLEKARTAHEELARSNLSRNIFMSAERQRKQHNVNWFYSKYMKQNYINMEKNTKIRS